ncbi:hypothetical protein [Lamprocystis purpurea]|uniref:hypothetical protein n=1 Tax=Lamprocystis purpurea TaxID=61598 RepID=UPI00058DCE9C|nr:hypothetical protein [Lamprocystis purpurea]
MTRFRQVTSPASGLLRSLILDSVLFGNRLKSDRLLEPDKTAWFDAGQAHRCGFWRTLYPALLDRTYALQGN